VTGDGSGGRGQAGCGIWEWGRGRRSTGGRGARPRLGFAAGAAEYIPWDRRWTD